MEIEERRVKTSRINDSETVVRSGPKGDRRMLISEYLME